MRKKSFNPFLFVGLLGTLIAGTSFSVSMYNVFFCDRGIWWTHRDMRAAFDDTKNEFELFIAGKPLKKHLAAGTLFLTDENKKQNRIVSEDITARLNNWSKVKATMLIYTTITGFIFGISITLFAIGLFQVFSVEKKVAAN